MSFDAEAGTLIANEKVTITVITGARFSTARHFGGLLSDFALFGGNLADLQISLTARRWKPANHSKQTSLLSC